MVHAEHDVDASLPKQRDREVPGEIAVAQHDVSRLEPVKQSAEQCRLAGLLSLIATDGQVTHCPSRQADQGDDSGDRKTDSGLLRIRLWEGALVLLRVG